MEFCKQIMTIQREECLLLTMYQINTIYMKNEAKWSTKYLKEAEEI